MSIKFTFLLKALNIKQKGKLKKDKEGRENWIQISLKYKIQVMTNFTGRKVKLFFN